mgnify:CR=1 FL=1
MLRTVVTHGDLAERFGGRFTFDIATPREAGRALASQVKGFGAHVAQRMYRVVVGPLEKGDDRLEDELDMGLGKAEELHIYPVITGSGGRSGGLIKVVLGVALIGTGVGFGATAGFGALAIGGPGSLLSVSWSQIALFGLSMTLSGASALLSPQPKAQRRVDERSSFLFDGPVNVTEQGNVVPLVYGTIRTGGIVVSAALDTEQL